MLATQGVQPSVDGVEEAAELKLIFRQVDLLLLRASGVAARFAAKPYYEEEGFVSPIEWIRFECHQTSTAAADVIAVGENLERLPQTVQATRAGEIGFPHLKTMARTANFIGGGFDEVKLLPQARDNSAGKVYYNFRHHRRARCGPRVLAAAHLGQGGGAAGLRRLGHPHRARLQLAGDRCRARHAHDQGPWAQGAQRTRPGLHLAGLRAAGELDVGTSHQALAPWRHE